MNFDGQNLTLLLISIIAPIGAFDVIYYHIYKFRLAQRPESRAETMTHIFRSLALGLVTLLITFFEPAGFWFWIIAGIFAIDLVNSALDAFLEGDSRKQFGGLPPYEYMIHIVAATWMGAVALSFLLRGWHLAEFDTALTARDVAVPLLMKLNAIAIIAGSFALAGYESLQFALGGSEEPMPNATS